LLEQIKPQNRSGGASRRHFCFGVIKPLIAIKANIFVEAFANQNSQQNPKTKIWRKEPNFSFWLDIVIF
jgi:hypothetical protein